MEKQEFIPPSAERVAQRALVLTSMTCRGFLERDAQLADSQSMLAEILPWLESVGAAPELEPRERMQLATPLGQLEAEAGALMWQTESSAMLAWALGKTEAPPLYEQVEPGIAGKLVGFLSPKERTPMINPELRSADEIRSASDLYLTLHWRLREYHLRPRQMDFRAFVEGCTWGPLTLNGLELMEDELAVHGQRIDRYGGQDLMSELGVTGERHRALNWLVGWETLYSDVTAAT